MKEAEYLALPVEEQNAAVARALVCCRPPAIDTSQPQWWQNINLDSPARFVNGDGNAFFAMWDALHVTSGRDSWVFESWWDGTPTAHAVYLHHGEDACYDSTPNAAVAVALLKAKGVIQENPK